MEAFIVKEGEFKFVKRFDLMSGNRKKSVSLQNSPVKTREMQLVLKSNREVFGDVEVLEDLPRAYTCICVSTNAQVYCVDKAVGSM